MKMTTVDIDLAKNVFQIHGVDDYEKTVLRKQLNRAKVLEFFLKQQPCLIGLEPKMPHCGRLPACHNRSRMRSDLQMGW